jgi:hypothetical protein
VGEPDYSILLAKRLLLAYLSRLGLTIALQGITGYKEREREKNRNQKKSYLPGGIGG